MRRDLLVAIPALLTGLLLAGLFNNHLDALDTTGREAGELSAQLTADMRLLTLYQESCAGLDSQSRHQHEAMVSVRELMASNIDRLRERLAEIGRFPFYAGAFIQTYTDATLQLESEMADSFEAWLQLSGIEFAQCEVR